jgi:hypothetical protein
MLRNVAQGLGLDRFFGMTKAMENGHKIWNLEYQEVRFTENSKKRISKVKLHLVGLQEVRWGKYGTEPADHTFFSETVNAKYHLGIFVL